MKANVAVLRTACRYRRSVRGTKIASKSYLGARVLAGAARHGRLAFALNSASSAPPIHVQACALMCAFVGAVLLATCAWANGFELQHARSYAGADSAAKAQGMAIARTAFRAPGFLPLFGSSALTLPWENRAQEFFQRNPRGFEVFTIAKEGSPPLVIAQRLAALGPSLTGKKLALVISPNSFTHQDPRFYAGNFSPTQGLEIAFNTNLSSELVTRLAMRAGEFPETLSGQHLLRFALGRRAHATRTGRVLLGMAWPLGRLGVGVGRLQDHAEAVIEAWKAPPPHAPPGPEVPIDWEQQLAEARALTAPSIAPKERHAPPGSMDYWYLHWLQSSRDWGDFELIVAVLNELGANGRVISMPVPGGLYDFIGVSREYQGYYYTWLDAVAQRSGAKLSTLRDYDAEYRFYRDQLEHPSRLGWLICNRVIDDFYHDAL
jgi:D-alanine transfer protein